MSTSSSSSLSGSTVTSIKTPVTASSSGRNSSTRTWTSTMGKRNITNTTSTGPSTPTTVPTNPNPTSYRRGKPAHQLPTKGQIIVLVAPPFSGKSYLCNEFADKFKDYLIINQKELGGWRLDCIKAAEKGLREGKSVLIDRCNISVKQRKYWIMLGRRMNCPVDCLEITRTAQESKNAMAQMTLEVGEVLDPSSSCNMERLNQFLQEYEAPRLEEGFSKMIPIPAGKFMKPMSYNPLIVAVSCSLWNHLASRLAYRPVLIRAVEAPTNQPISNENEKKSTTALRTRKSFPTSSMPAKTASLKKEDSVVEDTKQPIVSQLRRCRSTKVLPSQPGLTESCQEKTTKSSASTKRRSVSIEDLLSGVGMMSLSSTVEITPCPIAPTVALAKFSTPKSQRIPSKAVDSLAGFLAHPHSISKDVHPTDPTCEAGLKQTSESTLRLKSAIKSLEDLMF